MLLFTFPVKTKKNYQLGILIYVFSVYCMHIKNKQAGIAHHDKTKETDGDISVNADSSYFFQRNAVLEQAVLLAFYTYLTKPKPY